MVTMKASTLERNSHFFLDWAFLRGYQVYRALEDSSAFAILQVAVTTGHIAITFSSQQVGEAASEHAPKVGLIVLDGVHKPCEVTRDNAATILSFACEQLLSPDHDFKVSEAPMLVAALRSEVVSLQFIDTFEESTVMLATLGTGTALQFRWASDTAMWTFEASIRLLPVASAFTLVSSSYCHASKSIVSIAIQRLPGHASDPPASEAQITAYDINESSQDGGVSTSYRLPCPGRVFVSSSSPPPSAADCVEYFLVLEDRSIWVKPYSGQLVKTSLRAALQCDDASALFVAFNPFSAEFVVVSGSGEVSLMAYRRLHFQVTFLGELPETLAPLLSPESSFYCLGHVLWILAAKKLCCWNFKEETLSMDEVDEEPRFWWSAVDPLLLGVSTRSSIWQLSVEAGGGSTATLPLKRWHTPDDPEKCVEFSTSQLSVLSSSARTLERAGYNSKKALAELGLLSPLTLELYSPLLRYLRQQVEGVNGVAPSTPPIEEAPEYLSRDLITSHVTPLVLRSLSAPELAEDLKAYYYGSVDLNEATEVIAKRLSISELLTISERGELSPELCLQVHLLFLALLAADSTLLVATFEHLEAVFATYPEGPQALRSLAKHILASVETKLLGPAAPSTSSVALYAKLLGVTGQRNQMVYRLLQRYKHDGRERKQLWESLASTLQSFDASVLLKEAVAQNDIELVVTLMESATFRAAVGQGGLFRILRETAASRNPSWTSAHGYYRDWTRATREEIATST